MSKVRLNSNFSDVATGAWRCITISYLGEGMPIELKQESREAKHGEKMIEVKIRFWTDSLADDPGKVIPKHAWTSGVVRIASNKSHGIVPGDPRPFNSLLDVSAVVEQVLIDHGVMLHPSRRMQKYVSGD